MVSKEEELARGEITGLKLRCNYGGISHNYRVITVE